ncbi:TonB-dependent receptor [Weeksellaceae bacterium TAE3-ERU29]|nr:TonB-dependent receptor [Weeksellaceae bacterium TAE3-ERU29]
MENKIIKLKKILGAMAIVLFSFGHAQMTLEGTVKSAEGYPEADAKVSVDGKSPVFTGPEGNYTLKVQPNQVKNGKVTIVVEGVTGSLKTKVITYTQGATKKANFELGGIDLEEVVAIGYGTAKKSDLSGAVVSFKPDETLAATTNSIADLLQGQASGVSINTGGSTPGAASSVIIRGANSLKGDSQPLYVIDNVPQSSTGQTMASTANDFQLSQDPLAGINPNDIEDIQILKDASATAIYGSRGANGVILITTKRGKEGDARITFSTTSAISSPVNLMTSMNLREYAEFYNAYAPNGDPKKIGFIFEGDKIIYKYNERQAVVNYVDWMDEALRTSFSQTYNLNANGGGKKIRYNLSAGFKNIEGIVKHTGFQHGDFRFNVNADLNEKLKINLIASGYLRENNMMPGGNPYGSASGGIINAAIDYRPYLIPENDPDFDQEVNMTTVLSWFDDYQDVAKEYKYSLSADLNYKLTPHLSYTFRTGGNLNNIDRKSWYGLQLSIGRRNNGYLGTSTLDRNNYNVENLLNYNRSFGKTNVALTAGVTYDAYTWLNTREQGTNFPFTLGVNSMYLAGTILRPDPTQRDYQLLSFLGRANVSFSGGKYILTSTFRADGTSKFEKSKRWGYFPSFAVAWNIKDEDFMQNVDFLNQLKLRAGYGETGSQGINPYNTLHIFTEGIGYADVKRNRRRGLGMSGLNNPELLWESTSSYNGGIDFGLFRNRIRGTVDVYAKTTNDLLMDIQLPPSTSFDVYATNRGSVYNKGIESNIDVDVFKTKDFTWNVGGNISFNKSKFEGAKSFFGGYVRYFGQPNIFINGEEPGLFYGYKTDGIVQESEQDVYKKSFELGGSSNLTDAGAIKIADANGDGIINRDDMVILGTPNPDFTYGLQTSVSYKKVKLSASFTGVKGGKVLNTYYRTHNIASYNTGVRNMDPAAVANAWTKENPSDYYPRIRAELLNDVVLDRYLESGSYFRCTDITLGYDLPRDILKEIKMDRVRLYLSVKNAFTITNYTGFDVTNRSFYSDPTIRGVDRYSFPDQRTFILGGSFTF